MCIITLPFYCAVLFFVTDAVPASEDLGRVPGLLDLGQLVVGLLTPEPVLPVRHRELGLAEVGAFSGLERSPVN